MDFSCWENLAPLINGVKVNLLFTDDKENISIVEYKTLQKQLDERNSERDELLFTIRVS